MASIVKTKIGSVKLELLRPGPAHNQLLSPLTPYIALCGADGPVTVRIPFEHRQLLTRLHRLRYEGSKDPATDEQRQSEIRDIGEAIGGVFGQVPALLSELGVASTESGTLVHLRLALSGFELGMLPFEAAVAPDGFPGSGSPLFLQMRTPISLTREIRRGHKLPVEWNRPPRILYAFAGPKGLYVPSQTHLQALREAIEPWIKIKNKAQAENRLQEVKSILTVLPDATLEKIRNLCAANQYTHVHILAHGAPFKNAGEERYGVVLCSEFDANVQDIVDGERLAIALTARDASGATRFCPTVVSLATCDSGNINQVITPGGSIAHELNAAGIPWVIASQFPLWMKASAIAAEVLYRGLLNGEDPRWVLYELRQRLRADSPGTHDWASIIAYSTVSEDFEFQVNSFRAKQIRKKFDVKLDRIDELVGVNKETDNPAKLAVLDEAGKNDLDQLCEAIRNESKKWRNELDDSTPAGVKGETLGLCAAIEKRISIAFQLSQKSESECRTAYEACRNLYKEAFDAEPNNHWVLTQYLSIVAILHLIYEGGDAAELAEEHGRKWMTARQIVEWEYTKASGENRVWALGTLAELALLGSVFGVTPQLDGEGNQIRVKKPENEIKKELKEYCRLIAQLTGPNSFPMFSTKRQFRRYESYWDRPEWRNLAKLALKVLGEN